jgi:hypothetical protein
MSSWRYSGFGLSIESDFPLLPVRVGAAGAPGRSISIRRSSLEDAAGSLSASPELIWQTSFDGLDYRMEQGSAGDYRFEWTGRAVFHLTPNARELTCGFRDRDDMGATRLLLDTVLWSVSLICGYELLHASTISYGDESIAFVAGTGGGKTSLAAALLRRGAELLSDDVLAMSYDNGHVLVHPAPPVMNLPLGQSGADPHDLGQTLAILADEAWINVEAVATTPRRLTAVCVLDRQDSGSPRLGPHPAGVLALLPHAFGFPGSRARLGRQFEILSDLVADTPVLSLSAAASCTPSQLADLVQRELCAPPVIAGLA